MVETNYDSHSHQTKRWSPSQTDVILVNVLVGEIRILHCQENGYCRVVVLRASSELSQSADSQSVRSRIWSELLQSTGDRRSERVYVLSEMHCRQTEDEDEVIQNQYDSFHLSEFHSWYFFFRSLLLLDLLDLVLSDLSLRG